MDNKDAATTTTTSFSAPTKLLLLRNEARVRCYRRLVAPGVASGLWVLQLLETTPEFVARIVQRLPEIVSKKKTSCLVKCGGGYDMLVLLDGAAVPPDVSKIPVMSVDVFLAPASSNPLPDDPSDIYGTIQPHETLWEHFNCQTQQGAASDNIGIFLEAYRPKISHSHQDDRKDSKRIMRLQTNLSDSWNVTTANAQVGNPEDFVASTTSTARAAAAASTAKTKKASAPKSDNLLDHGSGANGSVGAHRVEIPSKNSVQAKKKPPPSTSQGKKEDEKSAGDKRGTSTGPGSAKSVKKPKAATSGAKGKPKMYGFDAAEMQALEEAFDEVEEAAKKAKAVPVDDDGDETDVQETPKKARSAKKK